MRLVYEHNGEEVQVGDQLTLKDGEVVQVHYFRPPHKSSSSGKVTVSDLRGRNACEYYVGVIGAEWIEREDRADWDEENK